MERGSADPLFRVCGFSVFGSPLGATRRSAMLAYTPNGSMYVPPAELCSNEFVRALKGERKSRGRRLPKERL